jgi:hypothetical protein
MELEEAVCGAADGVGRFSLEQKWQIVEATLVPGGSAALVVRKRGVNAN